MFLGGQKTLLPRDLLFSLFSITCFKGTRKVYTTEKIMHKKLLPNIAAQIFQNSYQTILIFSER